jgi:hypothetical protein
MCTPHRDTPTLHSHFHLDPYADGDLDSYLDTVCVAYPNSHERDFTHNRDSSFAGGFSHADQYSYTQRNPHRNIHSGSYFTSHPLGNANTSGHRASYSLGHTYADKYGSPCAFIYANPHDRGSSRRRRHLDNAQRHAGARGNSKFILK